MHDEQLYSFMSSLHFRVPVKPAWEQECIVSMDEDFLCEEVKNCQACDEAADPMASRFVRQAMEGF